MEYTFECKIGILMKNLFLISVEDIIFDNLSTIF